MAKNPNEATPPGPDSADRVFKIESPTALVMCGGNSRGALQVGFYQALCELGLRPDFIVGSSIGALNGAFIAAGMSPDALAELWLKFRRKDAVSWNLAWLLRLREQPGLFSLQRLRRTLRKTLSAQRFEALNIPLTVVTTDLQLGAPAYWHGSGDFVEPILASMSLPGPFPPVVLEGHQHVDGGVANKVPLDRAIGLGARTVLMIECICCEQGQKRFTSLFDVVARSFSIAMDSKYNVDLERLAPLARVYVVRPRLARDIGLLDFRYTPELIEAGYRQSLDYFTRPVPAPNVWACSSAAASGNGTPAVATFTGGDS